MVKISAGREGGCQFFWMPSKDKVFVTLLINHYTSEVPYFLVQWRMLLIINALNCNVLYFSAVTSSIYIIITTATFIPLLLITSQIVFILNFVIIIVIIIIIIIIIITIININPPFSLSKLLKLWLSLLLLCSQDLNQLSQLRRNVNDQ